MTKSLTHQGGNFPSFEDIKETFEAIKQRLEKEEAYQESRDQLLAILNQLSEFELGRFLIKNRGALSGYWTHYIIRGFQKSQITHPLEIRLLDNLPVLVATQQRFKISQELLIKNIQSNSVVCSIPCGLMQDLETLELSEKIDNVKFIGIDIDQTSLDLAQEFSKNLNVKYSCEFFCCDAWDLGRFESKFDLVTSNGLNIYEGDDDKVIDLYRNFYRTLRPKGKLIVSGLSCPPSMPNETEWDMRKIDISALMLQKMVFTEILQSSWSHFRSSTVSKKQLERAGFTDIKTYWDDAKIFYTLEGFKSERAIGEND